MLHVKEEHLKLIKELLTKYVPGIQVWAYGSRVHGHNLKPFSDLDLVLFADQPLPAKKIAALHQAFTESNLPWKVDLSEWCDLNESFKNIILQNHHVIFPEPHNITHKTHFREIK